MAQTVFTGTSAGSTYAENKNLERLAKIAFKESLRTDIDVKGKVATEQDIDDAFNARMDEFQKFKEKYYAGITPIHGGVFQFAAHSKEIEFLRSKIRYEYKSPTQVKALADRIAAYNVINPALLSLSNAFDVSDPISQTSAQFLSKITKTATALNWQQVKTGVQSQPWKMKQGFENILNNGGKFVEFDLEGIDNFITEYSFRKVMPSKQLDGKSGISTLSEHHGIIGFASDAQKGHYESLVNDYLSGKPVGGNSYILQRIAMMGHPNTNIVEHSPGMFEIGSGFASQQDVAELNPAHLKQGLTVMSQIGTAQRNTAMIPFAGNHGKSYSVLPHEADMLASITGTINDKLTFTSHNGVAYDNSKIASYFASNYVSEGAGQAYQDMVGSMSDYPYIFDQMILDREMDTTLPYQGYKADAELARQLQIAGTTFGTSSGLIERIDPLINTDVIGTAHAASTDTARQALLKIRDPRLDPNSDAYIFKNVTNPEKIRRGTVLLATDSHPIMNINQIGGIGFVRDSLTGELRHFDGMTTTANGGTVEEFSQFFKRDTAYMFAGAKSVKATSEFIKAASQIDIGMTQKDLVLAMITPMQGENGIKTFKSQSPLYILAPQSAVEAIMSKGFVPIGKMDMSAVGRKYETATGRAFKSLTEAEQIQEAASGRYTGKIVAGKNVPNSVKKDFSVIDEKTGELKFSPKKIIEASDVINGNDRAAGKLNSGSYAHAKNMINLSKTVDDRVSELKNIDTATAMEMINLRKKAITDLMTEAAMGWDRKDPRYLTKIFGFSTREGIDNAVLALPYFNSTLPIQQAIINTVDKTVAGTRDANNTQIKNRYYDAFMENLRLTMSTVLPQDLAIKDNKVSLPNYSKLDRIWTEDVTDIIGANVKSTIPYTVHKGDREYLQINLDEPNFIGSKLASLMGEENNTVALNRFAKRLASKYDFPLDRLKNAPAHEQYLLGAISEILNGVRQRDLASVGDDLDVPTVGITGPAELQVVNKESELMSSFLGLPENIRNNILATGLDNKSVPKFMSVTPESLSEQTGNIVDNILFSDSNKITAADLMSRGYSKKQAERMISERRLRAKNAYGYVYDILQSAIGKKNNPNTNIQLSVDTEAKNVALIGSDNKRLYITNSLPMDTFDTETGHFVTKIGNQVIGQRTGLYPTITQRTTDESHAIYGSNIYKAHGKAKKSLSHLNYKYQNEDSFFSSLNYALKTFRETLSEHAITTGSAEDFKNSGLVDIDFLYQKIRPAANAGVFDNVDFEFDNTQKLLQTLAKTDRELTGDQKSAIRKDWPAIKDAMLTSQKSAELIFGFGSVSQKQQAQNLLSLLQNESTRHKHAERSEVTVSSEENGVFEDYGVDTRKINSARNRSTELLVDNFNTRRYISDEYKRSVLYGSGVRSESDLQKYGKIVADSGNTFALPHERAMRITKLEMTTNTLHGIFNSADFQQSMIDAGVDPMTASMFDKYINESGSLSDPRRLPLMQRVSEEKFQKYDLMDMGKIPEVMKMHGDLSYVDELKRRQNTAALIQLTSEGNQVVFKYNKGVFVNSKDVVAMNESYTGDLELKKATRTGLLNSHYFHEVSGHIASESDINNILNLPENLKALQSAAIKGSDKTQGKQHVMIAANKILKESGLVDKYHISGLDLQPYRKIMESAEKTYSLFAAGTVGSSNKNVAAVFEKVGLDSLINKHISDTFIDSIADDDFASGAFGQLIKRKGNGNSFFKTIKSFGFKSSEEFRDAIYTERNRPWEAAEEFFRKIGILRHDQTLGMIGDAMTERLKDSHGEVSGILPMLINTRITDVAEELAGDKQNYRDFMEQARNTVLTEINSKTTPLSTSGKIAKAFGKSEIAFPAGFDPSMSGIKKIVAGMDEKHRKTIAGMDDVINVVTTTVNALKDEDAAGMHGDGPGKGMKIGSRTMTVLGQHVWDQEALARTGQHYEALYGNEASHRFNQAFNGIATMDESNIVRINKNAVGKYQNQAIMNYLNGQIVNGGIDSYSYLNASGQMKMNGDSKQLLFDSEGNISRHAINEMAQKGISHDDIDRIGTVFTGQRHVSTDYAMKTHSASTAITADNFNKEIAKISPVEQTEIAQKLAEQGTFNIINIRDANTEAAFNTHNPKSVFGNALIVDLGEHSLIRSTDGARYVAVPYDVPRPMGGADGTDVRKELQAKISALVNAVSNFDSEPKQQEVRFASMSGKVDSLVHAVGNFTESKEGILAEASSTRLWSSGSLKGDIVRITAGSENVALNLAKVDGKSLTERAAAGVDTNAAFLGKDAFENLFNQDGRLEKIAKAIGEEDFNMESLLSQAKRTGSIGIVARNPMGYIDSVAPMNLFYDQNLTSDQVKVTEAAAKGMKLDIDGDKPSVHVVRTRADIIKNGEAVLQGIALSSLEMQALNNVNGVSVKNIEDPGLFNSIKRSAETTLAMSTSKLAKDKTDSPVSSTAYSDMAETLGKMSLDNRLVSSNYEDKSAQEIDGFRKHYKTIERNKKFLDIAGQMNVDMTNMDGKALLEIGNSYLAGLDNQEEKDKARDAIAYRYNTLEENREFHTKQMQSNAGLGNYHTYRARYLIDEMTDQGINQASEKDRLMLGAVWEHIDDMFQAAKHDTGGEGIVPKLSRALDNFMGVRSGQSDPEGFAKFLTNELDITNAKEFKKLPDFVSTTAEDVSGMIKRLIPEGKTINPKYFEMLRQGTSLDLSYSNYKYTLSHDPKTQLHENIERLTKLRGEEGTLNSPSLLIDADTLQNRMSNSESIYGSAQRMTENVDYDMVEENITKPVTERAGQAFSAVKKMFNGHGALAAMGLAGSIMAAGFFGGNPTQPTDGQAQGVSSDDGKAYEIPNLMQSYNTQGFTQPPQGYVINVNASTSKGQDYVTNVVNQAFSQNISSGNINMTMNIKNSASNISTRDIAQYIQNAL